MSENVIICFLGIDGSGKSTMSNYLYKELQNKGFNVNYTWWLEAENSIIRKIIRKVGNPSNDVLNVNMHSNDLKKKDKLRDKLFKNIYPKIVITNYIIFGIKKFYSPHIENRSKIMILDRYYYDIILALSAEFNYDYKKSLNLYKLFRKLFPDPNLIFLIDVPPEISYLRKKEEIKSIKNAESIKSKYENIYPFLDSLKTIRIDNTKDIDKVKSEILGITMSYIGEHKWTND